MIKGFASADFTFPLLEHDKVIKLIALLGFDGIDIGLFENRGHLQPSAVFGDAEKNGRILKKKVSDEGICVADVFLQCDLDFDPYAINHTEKARRDLAREWFLKTLEYANACESRHVTCLPGVHNEGESYEASFERAAEELSWRVEESKKAGLVFGTEAHTGSIAETPEATEKLVKAVPGLTLTLDYTHYAIEGIPDERAHPLVKYASHFHARSASKGVLQTVIKENAIDYPAIVREMKKTGYSGFIGIEYIWMEWQNANRVDNVSESIQLRELIRKEFSK